MEFTPSPTVQALAAKNHITPRAIQEITAAVTTAVNEAIQQGAGKDEVFLAGYNVGSHILSERGLFRERGDSSQYLGHLVREYIAAVTK